MTPERQKGYVYYRCHTSRCGSKTVREEGFEQAILQALDQHVCGPLSAHWLRDGMAKWADTVQDRTTLLKLQLGQLDSRLTHLTNALLDQLIDQREYMERKCELLLKRATFTEDIERLSAAHAQPSDRDQFFERMKSVAALYEIATDDEKRQLVSLTTSNRTVSQKGVSVEPSSWIEEVSMMHAVSGGDLQQPTLRSSPDLSDAQLEKLGTPLPRPKLPS